MIFLKSHKKTLFIFGLISVLVIFLIVTLCYTLNTHSTRSKQLKLKNPTYGGTSEGKWEGNRVYFGVYEQDNDLLNGQEPILWRVLQVSSTEILLLSEYGLDAKPYHDRFEEITWEDCTLRQWLNHSFLETAFSSDEQNAIKEYNNAACDNPYFETDAGNDTKDKVFLLSWEEVGTPNYGFQPLVEISSPFTDHAYYSTVSDTRTCVATDYAIANNVLFTRVETQRKDDFGNKFSSYKTSYWCIRTPHADQRYISYVSRWGRTTINFRSPVDHVTASIRPAIVLDAAGITLKSQEGLEYPIICKQETNQKKVDVPITEIIKNPLYGGNPWGEWEGNHIYFGNYKQNENEKDDAEPVLWRVLNISENRALLLTEYGIERKRYNEKNKEVVWADSYIREWMNKEFFNQLFSKKEQEAILKTALETSDNPRYKVSGGKDTEDYLFLLSWEDVINPAYGFEKGQYNEEGDFYYGGYSNTRTCKPTESVKKKGAFIDTPFVVLDSEGNSFDLEGNGYWWLRTPGFQQNYSVDVDSFGDIYYHELLNVNNKKVMVRPACWIDMSRLYISSYTPEGIPLVEMK